MRIGIDASRLNLEQKTGTEWYAYYIIKNLLDIDRKNQYFLFSREKLPAEFLNYSNVNNIILKWPLKKFWTLIRLSFSLKKYKLNLFFSPAHNLPLAKVKKIVTWHDLGYEYYPEYYSQLQLWSLKLGAQKLKTADKIITPSQFTKNDIVKKYQIDEDKIFVTPLGIDFQKYDQIQINSEILKKYQITKKYLLYIGRLENKKNVLGLIKAFNELKEKQDYQLVLIGKYGIIGKEEIQNEINNSPYQSDIKVIGWVEELEKINLLKQASLFCLLSFFEGFGISILEAMYCQVPILLSDLEVFYEFNLSDICYIENNISEISLQMERLLTQDNHDLIQNNYQLSLKYSWLETAQKTLEVLQN
ncbi:glycosyltransferase family 4 protein [bacterium]|nr:glycosyltransferase family 4 protein [bacterium]